MQIYDKVKEYGFCRQKGLLLTHKSALSCVLVKTESRIGAFFVGLAKSEPQVGAFSLRLAKCEPRIGAFSLRLVKYEPRVGAFSPH